MDGITQGAETTESFTAAAWGQIKTNYGRDRAIAATGTAFGRHAAARDFPPLYPAGCGSILKHYARCLAIVAAKALDNAQVLRFLGSAQKAITVEQGLHAGFLTQFGISSADVTAAEPSPACFAYTNFLWRPPITAPMPLAL